MVLLLVGCEVGTRFEYLFPITMIESLFFLFIVTFVTSAVCQRWVKLLIDAGYISNEMS